MTSQPHSIFGHGGIAVLLAIGSLLTAPFPVRANGEDPAEAAESAPARPQQVKFHRSEKPILNSYIVVLEDAALKSDDDPYAASDGEDKTRLRDETVRRVEAKATHLLNPRREWRRRLR